MKSLANFPIDQAWFLPRAMEEPSESLQQQVFPDIERWLAKIDEDEENGIIKDDMARKNFLRMLLELRKVFLQVKKGKKERKRREHVASMRKSVANVKCDTF